MAKKDESQDYLYKFAQDYIDDYNKKTTGAVFEWNQRIANEFAQIPIETLIKDPYFLGFGDKVYDGVLQDIVDLFEERKKRQVNLVIFMEGIGSGKTTKSSIITWLQWFELSLIDNPQDYFDLAPSSVIALINMNRFQCGFNKDYFPIDSRFTTEIRISRNNTTIFPGTSSALSALGYNLYGSIIDEAAFLEVTEDSNKTVDGSFDACEEMYNAIYNRMTSRFMKHGKLPGMICMISSPNFPDDFMHKQMELHDKIVKEAKEKGTIPDSGIFYRRRPMWEAKGHKFYPEFNGGYDEDGKLHKKDNFYIDTDNAEIISDPKVIELLDAADAANFPIVSMEAEYLSKVAKYLKVG